MVGVIYSEQVVKREYVTCLLSMIRGNRIFISVILYFFLFVNSARDLHPRTTLVRLRACLKGERVRKRVSLALVRATVTMAGGLTFCGCC